MTENMIWRVARAIYAVEENKTKEPGKDWRPTLLEEDENREDYLDYARAAIEAMREPADSMVDAAYVEMDRCGQETGDPKGTYCAMIDAALK